MEQVGEKLLPAQPCDLARNKPTSQSSTCIYIGRSGPYVRIQLAGANFLALAEVQVFATNLAASKPTAQLSTWSVYTSNLAVDSDLDGNFANGSMTHTHSDLYAWGASYNIGQVHRGA